MLNSFARLMVLAVGLLAWPAAADDLPASWFEHTDNSPYQISYDDLNYMLNASVMLSGPPTRQKAKATSSTVGTRLKNKTNLSTVNASNRIYFEEFKKNPAMVDAVHKIRLSLEAVPSEIPMSALSQDEQLAYWLNLYNVVVIDEINKVYPLKNLQDFVTDRGGLLEQKLLTIDGVKISLNDIQYKILHKKFPENTLILYGFYQGYIGSPSIRKHAYTAENVHRTLGANAHDFINSNRGTAPDEKNFRVAGYYERNAIYFPDFKNDLAQHLREFLPSSEQQQLAQAKRLTASIEDWTVTDIYGSSRNYGGGASTNEAALLGAFTQAEAPAGSEQVANLDLMGQTLAARSVSYGRFSAEQIQRLKELRHNHETNVGTVKMTDLDNEEKDKNKEGSGQD